MNTSERGYYMYRRDGKSWLKHVDFMILDLLILQIAFVLSYVLRHGMENPFDRPLNANMSVFLMLSDLIIIFFTEPFRNILKRGYFRELEAIAQQTVFLELSAVFFLFAQKTGEQYSRISMVLMAVLYAAISYTVRILWKWFLKKTRRQGRRSLLIVCTQENVIKTIKNINDANYGLYRISGLVMMDPGFAGMEIGGIPVVAEAAEAPAYAQKNWVDEVFVNLPEAMETPHDMMDAFVEMGVTVHLNLSQVTKMPGRVQIVEKVGNYPVLTSSMNYATTKQAFL